ncbi:MAG: hypothetical protein AAF764_09820 [Pseudomonadota bacterium]
MLDAFASAAWQFLSGNAPPTAYLVHAGMLCYAGGLLLTNQIWLRLLLLAGAAFDLSYFVFHPETPLWDAIFASSVIATANIIGLMSIAMDRLPFFLRENRAVLDALDEISPGMIQPGEVRRLMKGLEIDEAEDEVMVTRVGKIPDSFFLLLDGRATVGGPDSDIVATGPCFIAEIAFITEGVASADVMIQPGTRYVRWPRATITRRMTKNASLDRALRALISYDLAAKLAGTVPKLAGQQPGDPTASFPGDNPLA